MATTNDKVEPRRDHIRGREPTPGEQRVGEAIQRAGGDPVVGLPNVQGITDAAERLRGIIPGANLPQRRALAEELKRLIDERFA